MISSKYSLLLAFGIVTASLSACSSSSGGGAATGGTSAGGMTSTGGTMATGGTAVGGTGTGGTAHGGAATGGTATGGTSTGGMAAMGAGPADSTQASIAAYLTAGTYKNAPWISETAMPRDAASVVSPHGKVRVWMNDTLVASWHAGNGEFGGAAHTTGSMAVKEFYDDAGMQVGRAAMLKVMGASNAWVFYCEGTDQARCNGETIPYYGDSSSACNGCHGGLIYTHAP